jgi:hypothetical protein
MDGPNMNYRSHFDPSFQASIDRQSKTEAAGPARAAVPVSEADVKKLEDKAKASMVKMINRHNDSKCVSFAKIIFSFGIVAYKRSAQKKDFAKNRAEVSNMIEELKRQPGGSPHLGRLTELEGELDKCARNQRLREPVYVRQPRTESSGNSLMDLFS